MNLLKGKYLTFRTKLLIVIGVISLSFLILIISNIFINKLVRKELVKIYQSYIPLINLGPRLNLDFATVMRGLQDAVAAKDAQILNDMVIRNRQLIEELAKAAHFIYPENPKRIIELQTAVAKNFDLSYNVSLRLMKNETGIDIVNSLKDMQVTHLKTKELLRKAIIFDDMKLSEAFAAVSSAQKSSELLFLFISSLCLILVIFLFMWIRQNALNSLNSLTIGFSRFGRGNFETPIPINSQDEFGAVARNANLMARQIQSLVIELQATNKELEAFSYSVAHDLRAPLRASTAFSSALLEDYNSQLPPNAQEMLHQVINSSKKMGELIDGLLGLSRIARHTMEIEMVNLSALAEASLKTLKQGDPNRNIDLVIEKDVIAHGDRKLLQIVMDNLLGNAWKFTGKTKDAKIEFGKLIENGQTVFFVKDNGSGFDMRYSDKLFGTFQRLHTEDEFEGTGLGLATVKRIILRHHGNIWAKSVPNQGATFYFNLNGNGPVS